MPIDVNELLRVLPELIRENDTVKGAIITALSAILPTREDFHQLKEEVKTGFREQDKKIDAKFHEQDKKIDGMYREILWIRKGLASLGDQAGHKTEKLILRFWADLIQKKFGLDVEEVKERVIVRNVGKGQRPVEIQFDMFAEGEPPFLFEIKFHPSKEDVDTFILKSAEFEKARGLVPNLVLMAKKCRPR